MVSAKKHLQVYQSILGVGNDASEDEIRRAYRIKARQLHPDLGGSSDEMKLLNEAYETLVGLAGRKADAQEESARGWMQGLPLESVDGDLARTPLARSASEMRWLIGRSVCCFLLGLVCFAESGNELLIPLAPYAWLIRGLALFFLVQGAAMLYKAHRINPLRSEVVSPESTQIGTYRSVFLISVCALIMLVIVSLFFQQ